MGTFVPVRIGGEMDVEAAVGSDVEVAARVVDGTGVVASPQAAARIPAAIPNSR